MDEPTYCNEVCRQIQYYLNDLDAYDAWLVTTPKDNEEFLRAAEAKLAELKARPVFGSKEWFDSIQEVEF